MKNIFLITLVCLFVLADGISAQTNTSNNNSTKTTDAKTPDKKAFRPTKSQITDAQTKLKNAGKYAGEADGKYNDEFRSALKAFQAENGLEKTGRLDEATLEKMGIGLTDSQKGIETGDGSDKPKRVVFRPTQEQITAAQTKLKQAGLYTGEADGKYNDDLRTAIRDYQTANGLKRKGSLNRATLEKMKIELTEEQSAIPVNPDDFASEKSSASADSPRKAIFRASKDQIIQVQTMLKEKGLYKGEATGKLNPETRAAIREWQSQNNVNKTGTLNKETLEAMGIKLTDRQKEM